MNSITGSIQIPECAQESTTPVTVTVSQGSRTPVNRSPIEQVELTAPGTFTLETSSTSPITIEISSKLPGCTPKGGLFEQFVQVTNLKAR